MEDFCDWSKDPEHPSHWILQGVAFVFNVDYWSSFSKFHYKNKYCDNQSWVMAASDWSIAFDAIPSREGLKYIE